MSSFLEDIDIVSDLVKKWMSENSNWVLPFKSYSKTTPSKMKMAVLVHAYMLAAGALISVCHAM